MLYVFVDIYIYFYILILFHSLRISYFGWPWLRCCTVRNFTHAYEMCTDVLTVVSVFFYSSLENGETEKKRRKKNLS